MTDIEKKTGENMNDEALDNVAGGITYRVFPTFTKGEYRDAGVTMTILPMEVKYYYKGKQITAQQADKIVADHKKNTSRFI